MVCPLNGLKASHW